MVAAFKKKNTLEQTEFALTDDGFAYCNKLYKFDDVIETQIIRCVFEHRVILVGSECHHSIGIEIGISSGELLQVFEQPTWLSNSKLSNIEHVEYLFSVISQKSWYNRVEKYNRQLDAFGYFEYSGWRFYPEQAKLHEIRSNRYYDIRSVNFSKSYGFIAVKEKNETIGAKLLKNLVGGQIGIRTTIDTDVFFPLLENYFGIKWT